MADRTIVPQTEVPIELRMLVQLVGRSFYQALHIVCLDILSKYPCVPESDLLDVLRLQGSQRQLRQALTELKKDKLVKSQQKMEGESGLISYYYINYKHFVNVVKYKLDQIRKRIETEERRVQNRTSYSCPTCCSSYSDLDVDRLFNQSDSTLRCSHCSGILAEDTADVGTIDARTLISRLNEQIRPLTNLLKKTENVSLAPEVLEPEPQSIQQVQDLSRKSLTSIQDDKSWNARNRPASNIYGDYASVNVSVNLDSQDPLAVKVPSKAMPDWLIRSTVQNEESAMTSNVRTVLEPVTTQVGSKKCSADQIMMDVLTHEAPRKKLRLSPLPHLLEEVHYSSSSSDSESDESEADGNHEHDSNSPSFSLTSPSDITTIDEFILQVGNHSIPLNKITDDIVAMMTEEEKEQYKRVYQNASSHVDFM